MALAVFDLDLDVFSGPFDLLLTLVLREEVDLLELSLGEVVLAYLDHLQARGELDLEAATEFVLLIAALLELKSRLMIAGDDEEGLPVVTEETGEPVRRATKCDLCVDLPGGPACASACPHDALRRTDMRQLDTLAAWLKR